MQGVESTSDDIYPVALALTVVTHVLEIRGMLAAYRGQSIAATAYR